MRSSWTLPYFACSLFFLNQFFDIDMYIVFCWLDVYWGRLPLVSRVLWNHGLLPQFPQVISAFFEIYILVYEFLEFWPICLFGTKSWSLVLMQYFVKESQVSNKLQNKFNEPLNQTQVWPDETFFRELISVSGFSCWSVQ